MAGVSRNGSDAVSARTIASRNAAMPAPLWADTATTGSARSEASQQSRQSDLFFTIRRGRSRVASSIVSIVVRHRLALIEHHDHER